jgi:para-aminobenzoate synthetase component 1
VLKKIEYKLNATTPAINIEALSGSFEKICFFDSNKSSNKHNYLYSSGLLAIGSVREIILRNEPCALSKLETFLNEKRSWNFGYLSYDLKNDLEDLQSENKDGIAFPEIHFFTPAVVIRISENNHTLFFDDEFISEQEAERIYQLAFSSGKPTPIKNFGAAIKNRITKEEYIHAFEAIKKHILRGDIYEINFCQEFFAENAKIDPAAVFRKLNALAQAPFAAFCRFNDHYILSSSPERFLHKQGSRLISQPIKGTIKRSSDTIEDKELKHVLRNDPKEQNENVMIVDLVRNDLSRIAEKGSVKVDELFGIYSFKQVHQMISTVSCEIKDGISATDIFKATFPMGSMTGAPKVSAMKLIEKYESTRRGVYSGALGYIDPEGNFDFSVVIRTILYNSKTNYLSFMAGSAITSKADANHEYEECLLKAKGMFAALLDP